MLSQPVVLRRPRAAQSFAVAAVIGVLGGLIGLGGAEFRLPYLIGVLGLSAHQAVPVNLAISLATLLAATPARAAALSPGLLAPFAVEAAGMTLGAVAAAYLGAGWVRRLSGRRLSEVILVLLLCLGVALIVEVLVEGGGRALVPDGVAARALAGLALGVGIGLISSLLGVAGGEVIIPALVFGFAAPIKVAGSLSLLISLPTVLVGVARHARAGALRDGVILRGMVAPMALGSMAGAVVGGLLVGLVPADLLKLGLGVLLIWSAWKAFRHVRA